MLRCIPPAFPAPALLRATFYEFKRTPVTMINTMTPVRWRGANCIYTGYYGIYNLRFVLMKRRIERI